MADESKTSHSSPATWAVQEPTNSDSGDDPHPPPPTTTDGGYEAGEKDPEDQEHVREAKRRRICPSALDKCESIIKSCCSNNSNCLTFSFDPKFSCGASTPEVTPKFGSFNLVAAAGISTEIQEKAAEEKEEEEEEEEEKDDEIKEKRNNVLEVLGSTDGLSAD